MSTIKSVIFWDFDGTLGYREGMYSQALYKVLNENIPGHNISIDSIRPYLQQGFPWHEPDKCYCHLSNPKDWWLVIEGIFCSAYEGVGIESKLARRLANLAHECYIDPSGFELYEDTKDILKHFNDSGWKNVILSNHVPELPQIVDALGIGDYIEKCITSARIGYEKPNPQAFYIALKRVGNPRNVWMVGDSVFADINGAKQVGINAILVRSENKEDIENYSKDLRGVIDIIEKRKKEM